MPILTNTEFEAKYGFRKPMDTKERDMIIFSNLSDLQHLQGTDTNERINNMKRFMWDTEDVRGV